MDAGSINMVFDETYKKLCLVPRLNLPKLPISHTLARKSALTVPYYCVPYKVDLSNINDGECSLAAVLSGPLTYRCRTVVYCTRNAGTYIYRTVPYVTVLLHRILPYGTVPPYGTNV